MEIERLQKILNSSEKVKLFGQGKKTVLTFVPKLTGVHYYRLLLPLRHLDVIPRLTNNITESQLKTSDILFYNRITNLSVGELEYYRKKYDFKIIIDIDDYWDLPISNPLYYIFNLESTKILTKTNIENADACLVTSDFLYKECKKLNHNTHIVPNAVSFQDSLKYTNKINDKLSVTWLGSATHQGDIDILTNPMKKISESNLDFNLYLSGFNIDVNEQFKDSRGRVISKSLKNRTWATYERILTNEHKFVKDKEHRERLRSFIPFESDMTNNYERQNALPVDEYLKLYERAHVSLVPLQENNFNKGKSLLKLLEGAATNTVSIVSNVEPYKDFEDCYFPVNKQTDWYSHIKSIIEDKSLITNKLKILKERFAQFDISIVNKLREAIFDAPVVEKEMDKDISIYSICYDYTQVNQFIRYNNRVNTIGDKSYLFEYNPLLAIIDSVDTKYFGAFSYKFSLKTGYSSKLVNRIIKENDSDVYVFCPAIFKANEYLKKSEQYHPGFNDIFKILCEKLGLIYEEPKYLIYSNYFVATTKFYKDYIDRIIKPAIRLLEGDLKHLAWKDSNYNKLDKESLKKYTGLDYYPMHTFLLERLISVYLSNNNFKVTVYDK